MTSEGLLPSQGLYEWTPPPHISQPLHLAEIMKDLLAPRPHFFDASKANSIWTTLPTLAACLG